MTTDREPWAQLDSSLPLVRCASVVDVLDLGRAHSATTKAAPAPPPLRAVRQFLISGESS